MLKGHKKMDVSGPVLSFLQRRAGKTVSIDQLVKETGFDPGQIRGAISHYRLKGTDDIETLIRGKMWRWSSIDDNAESIDDVKPVKVVTKAETAKQVEKYIEETNHIESSDDDKGFYMMATAKDGSLILQRDCDGTIWKAEQL